jgi:hypothetical protein
VSVVDSALLKGKHVLGITWLFCMRKEKVFRRFTEQTDPEQMLWTCIWVGDDFVHSFAHDI